MSSIDVAVHSIGQTLMLKHYMPVWGADLAPEEAAGSEVKDDVNDLVEGGADAHVLLCI